LEEATNTFRVHSIVPMEMPWADRTLMPDFPGIEKAESTSEWDAGFPLTYEIRKKDDDYWKQYRGTPKAFITLAAGQKMWGNRFGNLTAIRFPMSNEFAIIGSLRPSPWQPCSRMLHKRLLPTFTAPCWSGRFSPTSSRKNSVCASSRCGNRRSRRQRVTGLSADCFLGFSFFLIIAALLLMAMLFQFGLEQRASGNRHFAGAGFHPNRCANFSARGRGAGIHRRCDSGRSAEFILPR
jgi:putative ABC transport system permease protein